MGKALMGRALTGKGVYLNLHIFLILAPILTQEFPVILADIDQKDQPYAIEIALNSECITVELGRVLWMRCLVELVLV